LQLLFLGLQTQEFLFFLLEACNKAMGKQGKGGLEQGQKGKGGLEQGQEPLHQKGKEAWNKARRAKGA
jgi:hypothetical protein